MKMRVKKGDNVLVIAGKDNKKTGTVLEVSPKTGKVLVENINIVTKHNKPKSQQDKGGIVKKPAFIDASNVMVICSKCGKATRIAHAEVDGKKSRICKKCNAAIDGAKKVVTKTTKNVEDKPVAKKTTAKTTKSVEEKPVAKKTTVKKSENVENLQGENE